MPIVFPTTVEYDSLTTVMNSARTRLNDELPTLLPVSGRLLKNNGNFTLQVVNTAWRKFQEYLANLGYTRFNGEQLVTGLPPVANTDPGSRVRIDWFNYFDGSNLWPSPVLPPDLTIPKRLEERQSGSQSGFCPMEMFLDGLPSWNKQALNRSWEWRSDAIYMPGALLTTDILVRYRNYLPDFADSGSTQWFQQQVPVMRCLDPLSYFICAEILDARADQNPFIPKAEASAKMLMNRDISTKQRVNARRLPRSGRFGGNGWGGDWC